MPKILLAVIGMIAVLGIVAAACDDDESPSTGEANQQLCSDLSALDSALAALGATITNPNSTVEQLNSDRDAVNDAVSAVDSSAEGVSEAVTSDLDSAYSALDQAIQDIPDDATLVQAVDTLQTEVQAVLAAEAQIFSELGC